MNTTPTVLITGATDGIGRALAECYAARGARLVLVGRRPLAYLDGALFTPERYCRANLADADCASIVEQWLREHDITRLDIVIHNAGLGWYGAPAAQPPASIHELFDVNLHAPVALTHALLPQLWRARGALVFVSSVAAGLPVPNYAVYGATKAALDGFARSLRIELRGQVRVQVIHPGAARTAMHARIGMPISQRAWKRFPTPENVAAQIVQAINAESPEHTLGAANRVLRFAGLYAPGIIDRVVTMQAARTKNREPGTTASDTALRMANDGTLLQNEQMQPSKKTDTSVQSVQSVDDSARGHCVITGAADGIGRALAERFAAAGYAVTGIDVDAARAVQVQTELTAQHADVTFLQANLADAADIARVLEQFKDRPPIDVFVHCAGISAIGRFAGSSIAQQRAVLDVNLRAPLLLTTGLLREHLLTDAATLVFVASLSVFTGYPGAAGYAASKDGIHAYARSLRAALAPHGQRVLTVYPGPTRTAHARRYSPDNRREGRRMPPAQLAGLIYDAVQARQRMLIPGAGNRLFALAGRYVPRLTEWAMRKTILEKVG